MRFKVEQNAKRLIFDSDLHGLRVDGVDYRSGRDGLLIYDQVRDLRAEEVELQLSTNTSTLIPAFRVLSLPYHPYFDERTVIESQNSIVFYWNPSRLAAFYNRFSTDELEYGEREPVIGQAVKFLAETSVTLPLQDEYLSRMLEPCKLLGFYQGFPIFDDSVGFAKLQSRLGIHVGAEDVMVSTPLDRYEMDVYSLAERISRETGIDYSKKKNRVVFPKTSRLLELLAVKD